jgi:L-alanine-DL-glutamate epimerase-like enolase superfamily enzyme
MKITDIIAFPITVPVPPERQVTLGIGRMVKRDTVIVKVTTDDGLVGWGESHHGRAHIAIAALINTTLKQLVLGMEASDTNGVWARIYKFQLGSHGMGAACAMAMSGIDIALWDIRGKAVGWPIYKLLGGALRKIPAYAGGIALGYQPAEDLVTEVGGLVDKGFKAVKLRIGDTPQADMARVAAVRARFGDDLDILTDANAAYSLRDARQVLPHFEECRVGWLEEPFPAHDDRLYREAKALSRVPLAAGENHYTRFEFNRLIEQGSVTILQPDISKAGGITETLRIAAMASAQKLPIHCHSSMGINMAATTHVMSAIDNAGYFEADCSIDNPLRDEMVHPPTHVTSDGTVTAADAPGLGIEVNEDFIRRHPGASGPGYV